MDFEGPITGTRCAPSYVNLYLCGGWEKDLFAIDDVPNLLGLITSWHRYIDDVLLFWSGTRDELKLFMVTISNNEYNIKFTMTCNLRRVRFVDLEISVNEDGTLGSSLFRKSSAGNTLLHATS